MYNPKISDEQVKKLYQLAQKSKKPMTYLVREAVKDYLEKERGNPAFCPECGGDMSEGICSHCEKINE